MGQIPKESLIKADEVYKKIENGKVNKWQKNTLILTKNALATFKDKKMKNVTETIQTCDISSVWPIQSSGPDKAAFMIAGRNKKMVLASKKWEEMNQWVRLINSIAKKRQNKYLGDDEKSQDVGHGTKIEEEVEKSVKEKEKQEGQGSQDNNGEENKEQKQESQKKRKVAELSLKSEIISQYQEEEKEKQEKQDKFEEKSQKDGKIQEKVDKQEEFISEEEQKQEDKSLKEGEFYSLIQRENQRQNLDDEEKGENIKKNHSLVEVKQVNQYEKGTKFSQSVCRAPDQTPSYGKVSKLTAETSLTSLNLEQNERERTNQKERERQMQNILEQLLHLKGQLQKSEKERQILLNEGRESVEELEEFKQKNVLLKAKQRQMQQIKQKLQNTEIERKVFERDLKEKKEEISELRQMLTTEKKEKGKLQDEVQDLKLKNQALQENIKDNQVQFQQLTKKMQQSNQILERQSLNVENIRINQQKLLLKIKQKDSIINDLKMENDSAKEKQRVNLYTIESLKQKLKKMSSGVRTGFLYKHKEVEKSEKLRVKVMEGVEEQVSSIKQNSDELSKYVSQSDMDIWKSIESYKRKVNSEYQSEQSRQRRIIISSENSSFEQRERKDSKRMEIVGRQVSNRLKMQSEKNIKGMIVQIDNGEYDVNEKIIRFQHGKFNVENEKREESGYSLNHQRSGQRVRRQHEDSQLVQKQ